uniref:Alpha-latrotoxin n=1 Tax=Dermatophagoides pteronyssinus TaxID=6956 RepID=A0A6P6YMF6_DERPT|nr:protein fem-1 homolog B-like [Dermatophagoides pteronyssinus]
MDYDFDDDDEGYSDHRDDKYYFLLSKSSKEQRILLDKFINFCVAHYDNEFNDNLDPFIYLSTLIESDPEFIAKILNDYCLIQHCNNQRIFVCHPNKIPRCFCYLTPIHVFAIVENGEKFLEVFIQRFPHLNLDQKVDFVCSPNDMAFDISPLWIATLLGKTNQMNFLLKSGADPNTISSTGSTPIRLCCGISENLSQDERIILLELLLNHKADINKPNILRNTPLMLASYNGQEKIVKFLLDNGANPNQAAYCGGTPLHFAVEIGNISIIKMLLEHGATLQPDISGLTPLFLAAFKNSLSVVDFLTSWEEKSNRLTIENLIIIYELLAVGYCIDSNDNNDYNDEPMRNFLRSAYHLRYLPLNYDGNLIDHILLSECEDPNVLPVRPKNIHHARFAYDFIQETQTLEQFLAIENDSVLLHYECLFALERFFINDCVKLAKCLNKMGHIFIKKFQKHDTALELWARSIRILIKLKVFVADDFRLYLEHLNWNIFQPEKFQYWKALFELAIQYLESFPLPNGLQAMSFQLDIHELCQAEHFTLNDVKVDDLFAKPGNRSKLPSAESKDIHVVLDIVCSIIFYFAKHYNDLGDVEQKVIEGIIRKFLKLNYTNLDYRRHMIHAIFSYNNWSVDIFLLKSITKLLLKCGANTNVYDIIYNTPLHYLSFYGHENQLSIRELTPIFKDLVNHIYYGKYVRNALHHFDYADLQSVHLDAVNIYNQTAFHIYPNLMYCSKYSDINLFPLKCLAARVLHRMFFRCGDCKTVKNDENAKDDVSMHVYNQLDDWFLELQDVPSYIVLNESLKNTMKNHLPLHEGLPYKAKEIWKLIDTFSERLGISAKLVEFIELHGPCKFVHLIE